MTPPDDGAGSPAPGATPPGEPRPYRPEDEDALVAAWARAFVDDPIFAWLMEGSRDRLADTAWGLRFGLRGSLRAGRALVIGDPIVGGAVWVPPGKQPVPGLLAQLSVGGWRAPFAIGLRAMMRGMRREDDGRARYAEAMGEAPWILDFLGVDPAVQGRGLGKKLVHAVTPTIDAEGRGAFLVTYNEKNVAFYRALGFEVVSDHAHRDVPRGWSMRRPPRP
jgi:ribosomal protein S18 acetylase RimI-like enzyme